MAQDPRATAGTWCPDCGRASVPGQGQCVQCGLDLRSPAAGAAEQANAQLHAIAAQLTDLGTAQARWLDYRTRVLAQAPRPTAQVLTPPPPTGAPHPPATSDAFTPAVSAMRPARTLSAATMLGVAGASLVIVAGIVFVAASWTQYGPAARMVVLIGFAGVFAWLGWLSQRNRFPTIGGSLGVVSAVFAGVAVYAARTGPAGVASFTFPLAVLVGAAVAVTLARAGLRAVGLASAGALALAIESGALEAAFRSDGVVAGLAIHSIIGALGGGLVIVVARAWTVPLHRSVARNSGLVVAFAATFTAVIAPYVSGPERWLTGVQWMVALAVCAAVAVWRPRVGTGPLTAALSWSAMGFSTMGGAPWGLSLFLGVTSAIAVVAVLRLAPAPSGPPGLFGLIPLATATALVGVSLVLFTVVPALFGVMAVPRGMSAPSIWWASAALLLAATAFPVLDRWRHPLRVASLRGVPAVLAGIGTVSLAVMVASLTTHPVATVGTAVAVAAIAQWLIAAWWRADVRAVVLQVSAVIVAVGGIHAATVLSLGTWGAEAGDRSRQWFALGSVAISVITLALAALRTPRTAGAGAAVVVTAVAAAATWSVTQTGGDVAVAAALSVLVVMLIARVLPRRIGVSMAWGAAPAGTIAGVVGSLAAVDGAGNLLPVDGQTWGGLDAWRIVVIAAVAVAVAPVGARLWSGGDAVARARVSTGIAAPALVVAVVSGLSGSVDATGPQSMSYAPAFAVGVSAVAYLVTWLPPWRSSRMVVVVAGTVVVTAQSLVVLGQIAVGTLGPTPAVFAVACGVGALGLVAWRHPRVALAPAVAVATLSVPATLLPVDPGWAVWAAVVTTATVAWAVLIVTGERRHLARWGALPVTLVAAAIVPVALVVSGSTLVRLYDGGTPHPHPMWWGAVVAAVVALLSLPTVRAHAAWVVAPALVVMAGLVPAPAGWIGLAVAGLVTSELAIRHPARWGVHPGIAIGLGGSALLWSAAHRGAAAIATAVLAVSALWIAGRSHGVLGTAWRPALIIAPLTGALGVSLGAMQWGIDAGPAVVIATGTALTMAVAAVATRWDSGVMAPVTVAVATVVGAVATSDLALAGVVILLSSTAWYGLSVLDLRWARWVALAGVSVAAGLLLASVKVQTWEAYTAIPAATLVGLGLWWMHKDPARRTYEALAPGLALALVPSYLALYAQPQTLLRPLLLVFAALLLAIIGVVKRWFAPLLATALTAVLLAVGQIVVTDALVPKWVAFAFVGGVILGLGLVAERISKMR